MGVDPTAFEPWLSRWGLEPDGEPFETSYTRSLLLPVHQGGAPAMLKIAVEEEERRGAAMMIWWAGEGAARVLAHEGDALLLERLDGPRSLVAMARDGEDDAASRILCEVADRLHAPRSRPPPETIHHLAPRFRSLGPAAATHGGVFATALAAAQGLLAEPRDVRVLHGDLYHENVLDGGARGWLAIDPKGVLGERGYDYSNIFCNPDGGVALRPERLRRQLAVVSDAARLEPRRLLQWVLARAGIAAAWCIEDGFDPADAIAIAGIAAAELSGTS